MLCIFIRSVLVEALLMSRRLMRKRSSKIVALLYPRHTKYVGVYSFRFSVRLFVRSFVRTFVRTFVRSSFRHRVKVFALKVIGPHIL